jgi:hypothetical protein
MPAHGVVKMTPAMIEKIAELFWLAFTDQQVADFVGINEKTIRRYRAGNQCPAIKKASLAREIPYRKKIWDSGSNWCGAAWFLERKYPEQFAKPEVQLNWHNTVNNNALTINLTSQEFKAIEQEAKPVREAIEGMFKVYRPAGNGNGNGNEDKHDE